MNVLFMRLLAAVMAVGLLVFSFNNCSDTGVLEGESELASDSDSTTEPPPPPPPPPTAITEFVSNFTLGTQMNTVGAADLRIDPNAVEPDGVYISPVLDAGVPINWESLSWTPARAYGKELLSLQQVEVNYDAGNINMSGNKILLHMNEVGAPTFFDDVSMGVSADHNATCTGATCPTPVAGVFGGGLGFSAAAQQFIRIPHDPELLMDAGTISVWFRAAGGAEQSFISKDAFGNVTGGHIELTYLATGAIRYRLQSLTDNNLITSATGIAPNVWHHLVASFGPAGMKLFIDGVLVGTNAYTGGLGTSSGGAGNFEFLVLGASTRNAVSLTNAPLGRYLTGALDEFAMFNRQLANGESISLYRRGAERAVISVRSCADPLCTENSPFVGEISEKLNATTNLPSVSLVGLVPPNRYFQYRINLGAVTVGNSPVIKKLQVSGSVP